jgi:hypothetical protein
MIITLFMIISEKSVPSGLAPFGVACDLRLLLEMDRYGSQDRRRNDKTQLSPALLAVIMHTGGDH